MREIRFRAWDKDDEEMHKDVTPMYRDGELENIIFDYENAGYDFVDIEIKYCDTVFLYEDNPYIIMQYTGLKDKNGKEIYEGDIVLFDSKVYPVEFKNGNFGVKKLMKINLYTDEMREYQEPLWNLVVDGCEIIGSIYENPELLGDSQ